jgi:hypothetical protein
MLDNTTVVKAGIWKRLNIELEKRGEPVTEFDHGYKAAIEDVMRMLE